MASQNQAQGQTPTEPQTGKPEVRTTRFRSVGRALTVLALTISELDATIVEKVKDKDVQAELRELTATAKDAIMYILDNVNLTVAPSDSTSKSYTRSTQRQYTGRYAGRYTGRGGGQWRRGRTR